MNFRALLRPSLLLALCVTPTLRAQENMELGRMWTFENPPLAYLEKEYGFKPDQKWLNSLRLAALRLGGETVTRGFCSASFVSPKGLIMTNNHCVRDAVNDTPEAGTDMMKSGFTASDYQGEIRLKTGDDGWLTVSQLNKITDVTAKVNEGITANDTEAEIKKKREANKEAIEKAAKEAEPKMVPQVVTLFQGGQFMLYQYKVYNDVRLVCIPHLQSAHFGGDPDNFTYPRYSMDFAFLRAYEDGKPADTTRHYFRWKTGGAKDNELVFVPGNPGTTNRLYTKAQMEHHRDVHLPIVVEQLNSWLGMLRNLVKQYPQAKDQLKAWMLQLENGQKAYTGNLKGLRDEQLMAQKTAAEKAFQARVAADEQLQSKYGDLWERIAAVAAERRKLEPLAVFHSPGNSRTLNAALSIVQAFDPDEDPEIQKEAKKELEDLNTREDPISLSFFADHVRRAKKWLDAKDPYFSKVLGNRSEPRQLQMLLMGSRLRAKPEIDALIKGGWDAIAENSDPVVVAARELAKLVRVTIIKGKELDAKEEALGAEIGKALFATYGKKVSPDATMTLRFTDGRVKGYKCNGTIAPYRTTLYGLYARNAEFDNEYPFDLPEIWLEREDEIDMSKAINFVSTNDITGGNSGSVVVNKNLEVVGLIFDGNIESLSNDYLFRDDTPRSVSVHPEGIMESLLKIYDAKHVAEELRGGK